MSNHDGQEFLLIGWNFSSMSIVVIDESAVMIAAITGLMSAIGTLMPDIGALVSSAR